MTGARNYNREEFHDASLNSGTGGNGKQYQSNTMTNS